MLTRGSYLDRRQLLRGEAVLAGIMARKIIRAAILSPDDAELLEAAVRASRRAFRASVTLRSFVEGAPWRVEGAA